MEKPLAGRTLYSPPIALPLAKEQDYIHTSSKSRSISLLTVSTTMTSLPCSRPTHILTKLRQLANACGSSPSTTCNGWINGGKQPGRSSVLEYDLKTQDRNCTVCGGRTLALWPGVGRKDCSQRSRMRVLSVTEIRSMVVKSVVFRCWAPAERNSGFCLRSVGVRFWAG